MVGNGEGGVREGEEEGDREVDASWMGGDELQIMVMREKLEMQLMAARIKAKPIFLPFEKGKKWKETYLYERDIHIWKETYTRQKRPMTEF